MRSDTVPVTFTRGVNLLSDPAALRPDEVVRAKNLWMPKAGVVAKRPAMGFYESIQQEATLGVQALVRDFAWLPSGAKNSMVVIVRESGVDKMKLMPPAFYSPSFTGTPKEHGIGLSKMMPCSVAYQKRVYVFNGESPGWYFDAQDVDAQGQFNFKQVTWNDSAANSVKPSLATVVRERMWYANLGPGAEDYVIVSDRFQPETIAAPGVDPLLIGGRSFRVGNAGEGPITAIAELSATSAGSEASTMVAVWKGNNMFLLTGEPLELDDVGDPFGDLDIIRVNTRAGCVSMRTVVTTPMGTLWAGNDDVWCMPHGGQPVRVGTKIRPALEATPTGLQFLWHAAYHDGQYKLALFSEGLGPSDTSACDEQWWLDLREGIPNAADARWMGPQVYVQSSSDYKGTWNMRVDTRQGRPPKLISVTSYLVQVDPDDPTDMFRGLSLVSFDSLTARDVCAPSIPFRDWQQTEEYVYPDIISTYVLGSETRYLMQTFVNAVPPGSGLSGSTRPHFGYQTSYIGLGADTWMGLISGVNAIPAILLEPPARQSGNEVLFEVITREDVGDAMVDKLWDGIELGYYASQSVYMKYISIIGYQLDTRDIALESVNEVDVLTLDTTTNPGRKWQTRFLPPDPSKRSVGKSGQIRMYDEAVILLTEKNYKVAALYKGTLFDVEIGYVGKRFTSMDEFVTAFIDALLAALSIDAGVLTYTAGALIAFSSTDIFDISFPVVYGVGGATNEQVDRNRRVLSLMGMGRQTGSGQATVFPALSTYRGTPTYYQTQVATLEMSGINVKYRQFKRRPT